MNRKPQPVREAGDRWLRKCIPVQGRQPPHFVARAQRPRGACFIWGFAQIRNRRTAFNALHGHARYREGIFMGLRGIHSRPLSKNALNTAVTAA
jgi:hypothetical protein